MLSLKLPSLPWAGALILEELKELLYVFLVKQPGPCPPWGCPFVFLFFFSFLSFFLFFLGGGGLNQQHMKVPRLGIELELQLPAYVG